MDCLQLYARCLHGASPYLLSRGLYFMQNATFLPNPTLFPHSIYTTWPILDLVLVSAHWDASYMKAWILIFAHCWISCACCSIGYLVASQKVSSALMTVIIHSLTFIWPWALSHSLIWKPILKVWWQPVGGQEMDVRMGRFELHSISIYWDFT